jgi:hypothetical protein
VRLSIFADAGVDPIFETHDVNEALKFFEAHPGTSLVDGDTGEVFIDALFTASKNQAGRERLLNRAIAAHFPRINFKQ